MKYLTSKFTAAVKPREEILHRAWAYLNIHIYLPVCSKKSLHIKKVSILEPWP